MVLIRGGDVKEKEEPEGPPPGRLLGNWLKAYHEYTFESESPELFHLWTGLSVLASAVRRNVWINQGIYILYPHMFVVLVGPPGKVAKSTTIRLGRTILYGVENIRFGPDSVTREELIRVLAKAGGDGKQAALTIHSTELSSLIEPSGVKMIQFLTDIYDGDVKWQYSTKGSGRDVIHNPVLNLLAGTTPSWVAEGMPADVIGHGFTSRVIFVYDDEPRTLQPFPGEPDKDLVERLINDLRHIALLKGQFEWTDEARQVYEGVYQRIYDNPPSDYRVEGYHWRKKIHVLKVAMLLSVAESDNLVIHGRDIETAWELLSGLERKMYKTFSAVGKYEQATDLERMLANIQRAGDRGLTSSEIYRQSYAAGDVNTIANMLTMLIQMKRVEKVYSTETKENVYRARV